MKATILAVLVWLLIGFGANMISFCLLTLVFGPISELLSLIHGMIWGFIGFVPAYSVYEKVKYND